MGNVVLLRWVSLIALLIASKFLSAARRRLKKNFDFTQINKHNQASGSYSNTRLSSPLPPTPRPTPQERK